MQTEILIAKNPMFYQHLAPDAFQALIGDGSWIPLVFCAVESVVQRHFLQLCELDWDYLREEPEKLDKAYTAYKTVYFKGLDAQQTLFAQEVSAHNAEKKQGAHLVIYNVMHIVYLSIYYNVSIIYHHSHKSNTLR